MAKVKRSEFALFLDTTPAATNPTWSRVGSGFTTGTLNYNPEVTTETYIHEDTATTTLERYAPNMALEGQCINTDAIFEFIDTLRRSRAVGTAAETDALLVYLYETPTSTDKYPAELQPVTIQIDSFGGDGGVTNRINFTIGFRGDPTLGTYDVSANSFTATP
jgi:hypothetical protein